MKHTKQKGNLGFSSTLKEIHKLGYNVFSEIGDNSRIDLLVEVKNKIIKLQIKYATEKTGTVELKVSKSGPNGYQYKYSELDIDFFSVYLPKLDKIIFVPAKLACQNKQSFKIRFQKSKNNQLCGLHLIEEFEDLNKILLDF